MLGLAILIVFASAGLLAASRAGSRHLVITLPYALRVLSTALDALPHRLRGSGCVARAPAFTVFRRITLPMMPSGIIGTTALCFLVSFDEVVISLFMTGPRISTLPVEMFHHVESRADPLVAASRCC